MYGQTKRSRSERSEPDSNQSAQSTLGNKLRFFALALLYFLRLPLRHKQPLHLANTAGNYCDDRTELDFKQFQSFRTIPTEFDKGASKALATLHIHAPH